MIYYYPDLINSDSAVALLLAQEILATGEFFPTGWYPANGELWVLSRHVLALPFVYLFGLGHIAYSAMQLVFAPILFWSAWYAIRPFVENPLQRFVLCSTLFIPFSAKYYEHIFGQVSYGPFVAFYFVLIGLIGRGLRTERIWSLHVSVILLICIATALGSPSRYVAYVLAPCLAGFAVLYLRNRTLRIWGPTFAMLAALPLGFALNAYVLKDTYFSPGASKLSLDSTANYLGDLGAIGVKMIDIFRLETVSILDSGIPRLIAYGYSFALNAMVVIGGILLLIHFVRRGRKQPISGAQDDYEAFAIVYGVFSFAMIILILIVMKTEITARYVMPQILTLGFFALAFAFQYHWDSHLVKALAIFVCCIPLIFAATPYRNWSAEEKNTQRFADLLNEKGLYQGYITDFWWANKMTAVSGGETAARAIRIDNDTSFSPYRWLSRRQWYERDNIDPFFLAIPQNVDLPAEALQKPGVEVLEVFSFDNRFTIFALSGHAAFHQAQPLWFETDLRP
jgi:hypothetical protein